MSILNRIPGYWPLTDAVAEVRRSAGSPRRRYRVYTTTSSYLGKNAVRKLHIGCGKNQLRGWLNSDFYPDPKNDPNIIHLNATKRFPFRDETFHYVFNEHLIEHLTYPDGLRMLQECRRVLQKNGRVRVSTPDLKFVVGLYSDDKSELQTNYIKWASDEFIKNGEYTDTMVINNFVRAWGHLFIYDKKTLIRSLELAGFVEVIACNINESPDDNLRDLENDGRMPAGYLQLETFTLEASKP